MQVKSVKEFQAVMEKAQVVGVTCLGITHPLFARHKFDVCIVDEAGQITLPVSILFLVTGYCFHAYQTYICSENRWWFSHIRV